MSFLVKIITNLFVSNKKRYIFVKEITIKKIEIMKNFILAFLLWVLLGLSTLIF